MDFNQVRYFLALADSLNFTRAAEACAVTQPALTQAIRRLEEEPGGVLLHRNGSRTTLTALGKSLVTKFQQIDDTRQLVKSTAKAMVAGSQATLNIGVMCTIGPRIISRFFSSYLKTQPGVGLVLHDVLPQAIGQLLATGALDGAFCSRSGATVQRVRYLPMYAEPMVVAFHRGHRFEGAPSVSIEEVATEPYVDRLLCEFRPRFFEFVDEHQLSVDVIAASQREDWVQSVVAEGIGVTILPEFSRIDSSLATCPLGANMGREVEFAIANSANLSVALQSLLDSAESYEWQTQIAAMD